MYPHIPYRTLLGQGTKQTGRPSSKYRKRHPKFRYSAPNQIWCRLLRGCPVSCDPPRAYGVCRRLVVVGGDPYLPVRTQTLARVGACGAYNPAPYLQRRDRSDGKAYYAASLK